MKIRKAILIAVAMTSFLCFVGLEAAPLPRLQVSENGRFLVTESNRPFFWLGDTAWELFHRLNREEAEAYLKKRSEQRFTIIQAVVLAELNGLKDPNAYGDLPLQKNDPTSPTVTLLGSPQPVKFTRTEAGLVIRLPPWRPSDFANVVKIQGLKTP